MDCMAYKIADPEAAMMYRMQLDYEASLIPGNVRRSLPLCPHCAAKGQMTWLSGFRGRVPRVVRTDSQSFHLFDNDDPQILADLGNFCQPDWVLGFWYFHESGNPQQTKTTSVTVRGLHDAQASDRLAGIVADMLAAKLTVISELAPVYEFDGSRLSEISL